MIRGIAKSFKPGEWTLRARAAMAAISLIAVLSTAPGARAACAGRQLLQCSEKSAILGDNLQWTNAFVLDAELFEAPQVHVYNRALVGFWLFETGTAAARSAFEALLFNEFVADGNFENIVALPGLAKPSVGATGIIDRKTAAAMSSLMQAEQREVVGLQALNTSLDRAQTAYFTRGRSDWGRWQESAAARFASSVASAIDSQIRWQRAVSTALTKRHRPYGVGSQDLKLAQRQVHSRGFIPPLAAVMNRLGLSGLLRVLEYEFGKYTFGTASFNVTQLLSTPSVTAREHALATALRHFANRIPPTSMPPA